MRLLLKTNAAGDIRCSVQRDIIVRASEQHVFQPLLVCSPKLQDSIYTGHFALKSGYGWLPDGKKFTSDARTRLREFRAILDNGPLENCVFLTGTLPGSDTDSLQAMAKFSAWIISRLSQWLRDQFSDILFFGVWEYQKRGALHLHLACRVNDKIQATRLKGKWKKRWAMLLDGVGIRAGADMWKRLSGGTWQEKRWKLRTDAQTVERSVSRYLSKYLSKGSRPNSIKNQYPPSTWWFANADLRSSAKKLRTTLTVKNLEPQAAITLFQSLGAQILDISSQAYPIFNEWDKTYKGVIGLSTGSVAGIFMRETVPLLNTLKANCDGIFDQKIPTLEIIRQVFEGRMLT